MDQKKNIKGQLRERCEELAWLTYERGTRVKDGTYAEIERLNEIIKNINALKGEVVKPVANVTKTKLIRKEDHTGKPFKMCPCKHVWLGGDFCAGCGSKIDWS